MKGAWAIRGLCLCVCVLSGYSRVGAQDGSYGDSYVPTGGGLGV